MNTTKTITWLPIVLLAILLTTGCSRSGSKMEVQLEEGKILATLTDSLGAVTEPAQPAERFWDDIDQILLTFCLTGTDTPDSVRVAASFQAIEVAGNDSLLFMIDSSYARASTWEKLSFSAPEGGFRPGKYRVVLAAGKGTTDSLNIHIHPRIPYAQLAGEYQQSDGFNLAAASLGGKVDTVLNTKETSTPENIDYLIDGTSRACFLKKDTLPVELVFSFHLNRKAKVQSVMLDTWPGHSGGSPEMYPKYVEVHGSSKSATKGFKKLASARLHNLAAKQWISFPPTKLNFLKLRILSSYGSDSLVLGEVRIMEERPGSVLADVPLNLINPDLGGNLVRFTSQRDSFGLYALSDGKVDNAWHSADAHRYQEFVFGFHQNRTAFLDKMVLRYAADQDPAQRPKQVALYYSPGASFWKI